MLKQVRQFAAINSSNFNLDTINPKDVHDSDVKAVGAVMKAM